jgi:transposase-like protein
MFFSKHSASLSGTDALKPSGDNVRMNQSRNPCKRYRFRPKIIQHSVWFYCRYNLRQRDIEELLAKRGIGVSYELVPLWRKKSIPDTPGVCEVRAEAAAIRSL